MPSIAMFVEDYGHEQVLRALLRQIAKTYSVNIEIVVYTNSGGIGKTLDGLEKYVSDYRKERDNLYDAIVVAVDANCLGYTEKRRQIDRILGNLATFSVVAIPDPHVERWLLNDSRAFSKVFGVGCQAPQAKCERGFYKEKLRGEIEKAGVSPPFGGIEYADELVEYMDLTPSAAMEPSLKRFIQDFSSWCTRNVDHRD